MADETANSDHDVAMPTTSDKTRARYWAFLSYSHHDKTHAKWLREALTRRQCPRSSRDRVKDSPSNFSSLFVDENEARAGSRLDETLQQALRESLCMIVICSPYSAASSYVADEIRYFKSLGEAHRILCLVVGGIPNATDSGQPTFECFPQPLRLRVAPDGGQTSEPIPLAERPIAANLGEGTPADRRRAIDKICSGMLEVPVSRYVGETNSKLILTRSLQFAAAILAVTVITSFYFAYYYPVQTLYRHVVERWGVPSGVDPVQVSDLNKDETAIEAIRRGWFGSISQLRLIDRRGRCSKEESFTSILDEEFHSDCSVSRACVQTYEYDSFGSVTKVDVRDQFGQSLETLVYADTARAILQQAVLSCSRTRSGVSFVSFKRHQTGPAAGLVERVTFHDSRGPRANHGGVFGLAFEYDDLGRLAGMRYLARDGSHFRGKNGVAGWRWRFDEHGNEIERAYFGADGAPTLHKDGFAGWRLRFDEHGNEIDRAFFGLAGWPSADKNGVAIIRHEYDDAGNIIVNSWFDEAGRPTPGYDHNVPVIKQIFDKSTGKNLNSLFSEQDDRPVLGVSGFAGWRSKYDERGNKIEQANFDVDGASVEDADGVAVARTEYDERGNPIEEAFFGVDGAPTLDKNGVAGARSKLDERGNEIERAFFGLDGVPILNAQGLAGWRSKFDERSNEIETSFFGIDGAPALFEDIAVLRSKFDERGNEIERAFFGLDGAPILNAQGLAGWRRKFDERSNEIETAFLGVDGAPLPTISGGFAVKKTVYDPRGNPTERAYYNTRGERVARLDGGNVISNWRREFNRFNQNTKESFFDKEDGSVNDDRGIHVLIYMLDRYGNVETTSCQNAAGHKVEQACDDARRSQ